MIQLLAVIDRARSFEKLERLKYRFLVDGVYITVCIELDVDLSLLLSVVHDTGFVFHRNVVTKKVAKKIVDHLEAKFQAEKADRLSEARDQMTAIFTES